MKPREIKICRNSRSKNIRIVVKQDLILYVFAPLGCSINAINRMLSQNMTWIEECVERLSIQQQNVLEILEKNQDKILFFGEWKCFNKIYTKKFIKEKLYQYLYQKALLFSSSMQVAFSDLRVRYNKRTLGSCSFDNRLSFSLLLFFTSYELIDYVIIHELSHIKFKNHSRNFWRMVENFCPDYVKRRQKLHSQVALYNQLYLRYFS